ncbi:MAG: hypothetical protein L6R42_000888 [Xanthoria sp. 1 TBL-2021]|nr:MAG: hypothetical protein L6R42_000888 [Xanthoria sp. 1 TBL-2021]
MSHPYANHPYGNQRPAPNPPPNGGLAPGMHYFPIANLQPSTQMFRPAQAAQPSHQPFSAPPSTSRHEPPGARLHGQAFEVEGVRVLFPLNQAVFHIMDEKFTAGVPGAEVQPFIYFTGLTVTEFFESLGIKRGVTEWLEMGGNDSVKAQTIMVGDTRAGKKLQEVGWSAGRGVTSKPIWLQIL